MSGVQSIERAFALLRALSDGPAGVTELAERADLPKSTVARILCTLTSEGAVDQDGFGGDYYLGETLTELAEAVPDLGPLAEAAHPHLEQLADTVGETTGLAVREDGTLRYIDHAGPHDERWEQWSAVSFPLHHVPSGVALLAGAPTRSLDLYLSGPLRPPDSAPTDAEAIDPDFIRCRVAEVSRHGYVWFKAEFAPDLCSVAAPVWGPDGSALAAVHVEGPIDRFPGHTDETTISRLVRHTADELAVALT